MKEKLKQLSEAEGPHGSRRIDPCAQINLQPSCWWSVRETACLTLCCKKFEHLKLKRFICSICLNSCLQCPPSPHRLVIVRQSPLMIRTYAHTKMSYISADQVDICLSLSHLDLLPFPGAHVLSPSPPH